MHVCRKKSAPCLSSSRAPYWQRTSLTIDTVAAQNLLASFRNKVNLNFSLFRSNYNHAALVHLKQDKLLILQFC